MKQVPYTNPSAFDPPPQQNEANAYHKKQLQINRKTYCNSQQRIKHYAWGRQAKLSKEIFSGDFSNQQLSWKSWGTVEWQTGWLLDVT